MSAGFVEVKTPDGLKFVDFDKKVIKRRLRKVGRIIQKEARRLISRQAVSAPGDFPGTDTGVMSDSVKATVSRSGHSVWIRPTKTAEMRDFYPAFVIYGHRGPKTDSQNQRSKKRKGKKVAEPRKNFIEAAANNYAPRFAEAMEAAFDEGIKA
ncbi:hypothetical protein [uncultured Parasutterella sp.]|uniref:hypothetical protein n=1 Tax=uncultured Parasutterella sp. TaxID=1263098 RepID=UPI0025B383CD|nr:hypothetical protein [uncultured Parasutterella sp.]